MITIKQADTDDDIETSRGIFREYESWLGLDLCFQGFEDELRGLPGKYVLPDGRLLLAYADEKLAGCAALRKLEPGVCEMKRLFVRDAFRGLGVGKLLIEKLIAEAAKAGYETMRLDTYPAKMKNAVALYYGYGFYEISPYYKNPYPGVLFMERLL
jgi:ribosomal protein S18 acetylase RimI-like enzyme